MNDQFAGTIPILGVVDVPGSDPAAAWPAEFCRRATTRGHLDADPGQEFTGGHAVVFPAGVLIDGELFSYGRLSECWLRRHLDNPTTRR